MNDFEVPSSDCPHCGHKNMDRAGSLSGGGEPRPHDVSVCICCAGYLEYDNQLKLIPLSIKEFDSLPPELQEELTKIRYAVLTVRSEAN